MTGELRKLKDGYGFIAGNDGIDYFFHWSGLSKFTKQFRYCKEGEKADFEVQISERGPRAVGIKIEGYTIIAPVPEIPEITANAPVTV
jgi:cold shock CspA family protein